MTGVEELLNGGFLRGPIGRFARQAHEGDGRAQAQHAGYGHQSVERPAREADPPGPARRDPAAVGFLAEGRGSDEVAVTEPMLA
jgi:hypothetical protein